MPNEPTCRQRLRTDIVLATFLLCCAFAVVRLSPVRRAHWSTKSDPYGCLLTSQSILEHGTIRLDAYGTPEALSAAYGYRVRSQGSHTRYYFPLGTSLLAVPAVAAGKTLGWDMRVAHFDRVLQGWLAAMFLGLIALGAYVLCRARHDPLPAAILAMLFVFGTSLSSTCGSALWSFNAEVLFMLAALCLLLHCPDTPRGRNVLWPALGVCMFLSYLCRPSAAVFAAVVTACLFLRRPRVGWRVCLVLLVCLLGLAAFSLREYGAILPPYYRVSRLAGSDTFLRALGANLVSPSRGILVFSPFFVPVLFVGLLRFRESPALLAAAWLWMALELVAVSRFPHWWAGHSYGPRILTDAVPAVLLVAVLTAPTRAGALFKAYWVTVVCLGLVSALIHTGQGLGNECTARWNIYPEIDRHPELVLDWRYPQWAATPSALARRATEHERARHSAE